MNDEIPRQKAKEFVRGLIKGTLVSMWILTKSLHARYASMTVMLVAELQSMAIKYYHKPCLELVTNHAFKFYILGAPCLELHRQHSPIRVANV